MKAQAKATAKATPKSKTKSKATSTAKAKAKKPKAISMQSLEHLLPPGQLAPLCRSIAMLDAILFPDDWESRYHSYDASWGKGSKRHEELFSMRDHSGNFYFLWFPSSGGAVLRGFDHESAMSPWSSLMTKMTKGQKGDKVAWPNLYAGLPKSLDYARTEPAFCGAPGGDEVSFCAWWSRDHERKWRTGTGLEFPKGIDDPDGSKRTLFILDGKPATYKAWADDYTEGSVPLAAIEKIYALTPLTEELVRAINPEATLADVRGEAKEIGYPIATAKKTAQRAKKR